MDQNIVQEMLRELFASLETLDTQTNAIRQLLKDKGIAPQQELAPYLEQAGNASSVRWLAVRVRMDSLLASAMKPAEQDARKDSSQTSEDRNDAKASVDANKKETNQATALSGETSKTKSDDSSKDSQGKDSPDNDSRDRDSRQKDSRHQAEASATIDGRPEEKSDAQEGRKQETTPQEQQKSADRNAA